MLASMATPTQELASLILGVSLDHWVAERRDRRTPWRDIAAELAEATNGKVSVSGEAIRTWYGPPALVEDDAA